MGDTPQPDTAPLVRRSTELATVVGDSQIRSQSDYEAAIALGKNGKELELSIVAFFKPMKAAAHATHKAITTRESEVLAPVRKALAALRSKVSRYATQQRERQQQTETRRAEKAAETGQRAAPVVDKTQVAGVANRQVMKFEVVDVELLAKKRPDLILPNTAKIRAEVNGLRERVNIPGVKAWAEAQSAFGR